MKYWKSLKIYEVEVLKFFDIKGLLHKIIEDPEVVF
jgi:hypothetical protein